MEALPFAYLLIGAGILALVIGWVLLPVALIGTKPLLRQLIAETKRTNDLLERLPDLGATCARSNEHFISRGETK